MATDYYADALLFARRNSLRNVKREPETRLVDWRAFPTDLGRFDLVLASDAAPSPRENFSPFEFEGVLFGEEARRKRRRRPERSEHGIELTGFHSRHHCLRTQASSAASS